jgi:diguanylate cyclase (GGDEF)-like protein
MAKWYFDKPRIPRTGAILSLLALAVPVVSTVTRNADHEFEALIWLSALIPAFLLAYYRGWRGVALGFATAMVALTGTQLLVLTQGARLPDWPLMLAMTGVFIAISLLLGAVVERLHEARERAESLALFDPLTSLPNRRYLDLMFHKDFAAARRGVPLAVVLFDLDNFKEFNDRHGHSAGDELLRKFAQVLARNTREMNLSARIGGEEFMSLAAASQVQGALVFVDRVRQGLKQIEGTPEAVTVSVGVAAYEPGMTSPSELFDAADEALYRAKQSGRDQVMVGGHSEPQREMASMESPLSA